MGSKTTWYSGFVSSNRRSIEVRSSSTDCLIGSPTRAKPIAEIRIGREFITQERAQFVGVSATECGIESIAVV